jgi:hypothetical protein
MPLSKRAIVLAALAVLWPACAAFGVEIRSANFADRWIEPSGELRIRFSGLLEPGEGQYAFIDGASDLTPLFRQLAPGEYVYNGRELPLAQGQRKLKVFLVKDGQWKELTSLDLKVTSAGGFEQFDMKPQLDATVKGQLGQGRSGSAPQFTRSNQYQDGTFKGGLGIEAARGDFRLSSNVNVVGSTFQREALRFGTLGDHAPQADITDYIVNTQSGGSQFSLGHINYGNNPLLLMGYGSRGGVFRQQLGQRADFSLNAMNGTSITGAGNILGLDHSEHQVRGGTLGVELLERKGGLRAEMQYLDASLESQVPFNTGSIPDAEKIRGTGLRLLGASESGRLRGDLALARVRHAAANDPTLAQGQTLTEIKPVTKGARSLDLAYDLVKADPGAKERLPFGLTATLRHERVEPLFKSIGVGFASDQQLNRAGLSAQLGPLQGQASLSRREDNLDNTPSLLKTRTEIGGYSLTLPLAQLWPGAGGAPDPWMPSLTYRHEQTHQRAINTPVNSLFNAGLLPDQLNKTNALGANWQAAALQLGYTLNLANLDNRTVGKEAADFRNLGHNFTGGYKFTPAFGVTAGFGRTASVAKERALESFTYNYSGGFDWQFRENWGLNGNYARTSGRDSQNLVESRGWTMQTQLAWRFTMPAFGIDRKLPGQLFVRHFLNDNYNLDNTFGTLAAGRVWMIQTGVTVSFF